MQAEFEIFDHTADMGFYVRAATMSELLAPAAEALYAVIGLVEPGVRSDDRSLEFSHGDAADLLRDFLAHLLYLFERDRLRAISIRDARLANGGLSAIVSFAVVNETRSDFQHEVKAVTYHELDIKAVTGGFQASFIVDL